MQWHGCRRKRQGEWASGGQGRGGEFYNVGPPICSWNWQLVSGNLIKNSFVRSLEGSGQHLNGFYNKRKKKWSDMADFFEKMGSGRKMGGKTVPGVEVE